MALDPGTRLGPYEVTAQIGVGGMGEVYRATDTNLKRSVALKVLPAAVASDPDRLARFQREAEMLAALNHPNIAAIYGLERADGTTALVMELVEGPTLADRIAQGAIPLDEALPIARQLAEALEAAHEQGIIHRDLKPANIKVRPDGTVKVLDFGLAKAMEPAGAATAGMSQMPTITTPAMTQAGTILGTAAYMSPEQARGKPADKRADIWAFGCVLYEMLTGRRAFEGDEIADTLAMILTKAPDWSALPPSTPAAIARLLRRTLAKDKRDRLGDASAIRLEVADAITAPSAETTAPPVTASRSGTSAWGRLPWVIAAVSALVAVALLVPAQRYLSLAPTDPQELRLDMVTPPTTDSVSLAVSPDGRQIVFVATSDGRPRLWLRALDSDQFAGITGPWVSTVSQGIIGEDDVVTFSSTAVLTTGAATNRADTLIPEVP